VKKDWEIKKLGDVCDLQNGFAFKSSDYVEKSNVMNFRMSQIRPDGTMDLYHNTKYLPEDYANKYSDYLLSDGDVVIAMTDMASDPRILGRPTIVFTDGYKVLLNQRVGKLFKFDKNIYPKFLNYMLVSPSICDYYKSLGRGGLQLNISKQDILNASIPVPPLEEQKRIVKVLDEKFTHLETIKTNAQTNLQNAKDLFQSQLTKAFSNTTWEKAKLEDIALDFSRGKSKHRPRNDKCLFGGDYPFIQTGDIRNADKYVTDYSETYNETGLAQSKLWPAGTLCITIAANIAETAILSFSCCFPDSVIGFIPNEKLTTVDFVYYLIQFFKSELQNLSKGAAQDNLNLAKFENMNFPLPPLPEQKRIVKELDTLSEKVRQLQEIYTKQIANCDELKQSLLQKAFEGEL